MVSYYLRKCTNFFLITTKIPIVTAAIMEIIENPDIPSPLGVGGVPAV